MSHSHDLDALVVGAGPTGLAMAGDLLRHGMRVRLIDQAEQPTTLSKAVVVMPRTLEEFKARGLAEASIAQGEPSISLTTYFNGHVIFHSVYNHLATDYSYLINTPQAATESVLRDYLQKQGGQIEWQTKLAGFEEEGDGVNAVLEHPDGRTEKVRSHYLMGCDGAHSTVRHGLNIGFKGAAYPENWLLADVKIDWRFPHGHTYLFVEENGLFAVFPMPEERDRIYVVEPGKERNGRAPTLEEFQELADRFVRDGCILSDPRWLSEFHCQHRKVEEYSKGRVFLAGDAAHIHSPETGLGMNTGIQDAFNLAWKVAHVRKGWSDHLLLDTYDLERNHVGKEILKLSDSTHKIWAQFGWLANAIREPMWRFFTNYYAHHTDKLEEAVQIRIHYPKNPLVHQESHPKYHTVHPPEAGTRATNGRLQLVKGDERIRTTLFDLLDANKYRLMLFPGAHCPDESIRAIEDLLQAIEKYSERIEPLVIYGGQNPSRCQHLQTPLCIDPTLHLHFRYAAQRGAVFLLRPDLYFGYVALDLQRAPLEKYLQKLFPEVTD